MKLISIGKISFRYIFLLLIPIFWAGNTFTAYPLYKFEFVFHPLFFCLLISLGEFVFGGLFELISYFIINSKRNRKTKFVLIDKIQIVTLHGFEKQVLHETSKPFDYLLIGGLGAIDFIGYVFINISSMQSSGSVLGYQLKPCQIITTALFSIFILKLPLHLHHICSILAIMVGIFFIIGAVAYILRLNGTIIIIFLLTYTCFSLKDVGEKWLMEKQFYSPFRILLFEGLVGMIVSIPIFIAAYFTKCQNGWAFCKVGSPVETFSLLITSVFSAKAVGYCFALLILNGGLNLSNILANHLLSPTHKSVGDTVSSIILATNMLVDNQIKQNVIFNWALIVPGDIIILLACLVFNEIIVLYCCNLHKNTKVEIMQRSEKEFEMLSVSENDISSTPLEIFNN